MKIKVFLFLFLLSIVVPATAAYRPKRGKYTFRSHRPMHKLRLVGKIKQEKKPTLFSAKKFGPRYRAKF